MRFGHRHALERAFPRVASDWGRSGAHTTVRCISGSGPTDANCPSISGPPGMQGRRRSGAGYGALTPPYCFLTESDFNASPSTRSSLLMPRLRGEAASGSSSTSVLVPVQLLGGTSTT